MHPEVLRWPKIKIVHGTFARAETSNADGCGWEANGTIQLRPEVFYAAFRPQGPKNSPLSTPSEHSGGLLGPDPSKKMDRMERNRGDQDEAIESVE